MQGFERKAAYFTLRFDAQTERSIIDLWITLTEEGIELVGLTGHRPHINVSAYDTEWCVQKGLTLEQEWSRVKYPPLRSLPWSSDIMSTCRMTTARGWSRCSPAARRRPVSSPVHASS